MCGIAVRFFFLFSFLGEIRYFSDQIRSTCPCWHSVTYMPKTDVFLSFRQLPVQSDPHGWFGTNFMLDVQPDATRICWFVFCVPNPSSSFVSRCEYCWRLSDILFERAEHPDWDESIKTRQEVSLKSPPHVSWLNISCCFWKFRFEFQTERVNRRRTSSSTVIYSFLQKYLGSFTFLGFFFDFQRPEML